MHRLAPPGVDPLGPEAPLAFCFSPLVGTPLTTSAKFAVVAKSPLTGMLNDALASSHFAIAGKLTGHDAIVVRGACDEPVGAARRRRRRAARARRRPLGAVGRRGRDAAARAARQGLAGRLDRPGGGAPRASTRPSPTTAATPVAAGSARCSARRTSRRSRSAPSTKVAPADPPAVLAAARDLRAALVRSGDREVPRARHAGQPARVQRDPHAADPQLPGRHVRRGAGDSPPRSCAEARGVARDSCASCSIGCEHIYKRATAAADARGVRERVRPRPDVRRVGPGRRAARRAAAATSSVSTPSRPAGRSPGPWSAPSAV